MTHRAFSLLEMIVVMLIVGTLATIAAPRFVAAVDRYQAEAAPQRIVAEFKRAAATARAQRTKVVLIFEVADDKIRSNHLPSLRGDYETYELRLDEAPYHTTITAADFDGTQRLKFDGYGGVMNAGTLTIRTGRHTRVITVAEDGEITVAEAIDTGDLG